MYAKFLVEGEKTVAALLASGFNIDAIYATQNWLQQNEVSKRVKTLCEVSEAELKKISVHEQPHNVVAVASIPEPQTNDNLLGNELYLLLDDISDPGNLGTIIRTADWFGVKQIFLSNNSVDAYNPKVVSSAKGSLFNVSCTYTNLIDLINSNQHLPVYGTFLEGENVYETSITKYGFLVVGNEANGITEKTAALVQTRLTIPSVSNAESLNAAIATGIMLSEFYRKNNAKI